MTRGFKSAANARVAARPRECFGNEGVWWCNGEVSRDKGDPHLPRRSQSNRRRQWPKGRQHARATPSALAMGDFPEALWHRVGIDRILSISMPLTILLIQFHTDSINDSQVVFWGRIMYFQTVFSTNFFFSFFFLQNVSYKRQDMFRLKSDLTVSDSHNIHNKNPNIVAL